MGEMLIETDDRWLLGLQGAVVDQCCFDYAVVLRSTQASWELRLEQQFMLSDLDGTEHLVIPAEARHLEFVLPVLRAPIDSACAFKVGDLELKIGGATITVPPNDAFEAWTVTGPNGLRVVSMPGGTLAVWSPSGAHSQG
jgi:hypothetical protein